MLYPYTRAWTRAQKSAIAIGAGLGLIVVGAVIWGYEVHVRRSIEHTLIDHEWSMQGCMDCSSDVTFRRNQVVEVEEFGVGQTYRGTGTWQIHGRNYIELEYDLRIVGAEDLLQDHRHDRWHIAKLTSDELIVDNMRFALLYKRVK